MRQLVYFSGLGLLAYVAMLLLQTPASLVIDQARRYLPDLQAAQIEGTILAGSAAELVARRKRIEQLAWRWSPGGLLQGRWEYEVQVQEPGVAVSALVGVGMDRRLSLRQVNGELPFARALSLALGEDYSLGGRVLLDLQQLQVGHGGLPQAAEGLVHLVDARTTVGRPLPLGSVSMELETGDGMIIGHVRDRGGPLAVAGTLTLDPTGSYRFQGRVGLRDETEEELGRALRLLLGPVADDGQHPVNLSGRLPV